MSEAATAISQTSYSLVSVPQELTEYILKFCHPRDYASLSETCRALYKIIYNEDQYIWREAFLKYPFDDIRHSLSHTIIEGSTKVKGSSLDERDTTTLDWKGELQRRVNAEGILRRSSTEGLNRLKVLDALLVLNDVVSSAAPGPLVLEGSSYNVAEPSHNLAWVQDTLLHSKVFEECDDVSMMDMMSSNAQDEVMICQLRSRLRSYLTLTHEKGDSAESQKRLASARSVGRCFVYDLRNYTDATRWGPYTATPWADNSGADITVNWTHVENIQNVVFMNVKDLPSQWRKPAIPSFDIQAVRPHSAPGYNSAERNPRDWAGVEGVWRRVVCFMDYRDLHSFNFTASDRMRLRPAYFETDFAEATRIVEARFFLDDNPASPELLPEEDDDPDPRYPPLPFVGTARGVHLSQSSRVRGVIRKKKDYVRWSFVTTHDRSQWAAEGVQVGGIGSAMGVAGVWTVAVHEGDEDPAGPFWMWKAEESLPDKMLVLQDY
ncbi:hypothetical protein BC835DRAFT_1339253 [Cytidiella melzeri]|nr:hypothetical protein BC835DRAFT_1339253 [Cytidiella melzeri]